MEKHGRQPTHTLTETVNKVLTDTIKLAMRTITKINRISADIINISNSNVCGAVWRISCTTNAIQGLYLISPKLTYN